MANLTVDRMYLTKPRGTITETNSYIVTNALQLFAGGFTGISTSTGLAIKWADTANFQFLGIALAGATGNTSATPKVEVIVDESGLTLQQVSVTGVTDQTSVGTKVYATDDNVLTTTATVNVGTIGIITRYYTGSTVDVRLFSAEEIRTL